METDGRLEPSGPTLKQAHFMDCQSEVQGQTQKVTKKERKKNQQSENDFKETENNHKNSKWQLTK